MGLQKTTSINCAITLPRALIGDLFICLLLHKPYIISLLLWTPTWIRLRHHIKPIDAFLLLNHWRWDHSPPPALCLETLFVSVYL